MKKIETVDNFACAALPETWGISSPGQRYSHLQNIAHYVNHALVSGYQVTYDANTRTVFEGVTIRVNDPVEGSQEYYVLSGLSEDNSPLTDTEILAGAEILLKVGLFTPQWVEWIQSTIEADKPYHTPRSNPRYESGVNWQLPPIPKEYIDYGELFPCTDIPNQGLNPATDHAMATDAYAEIARRIAKLRKGGHNFKLTSHILTDAIELFVSSTDETHIVLRLPFELSTQEARTLIAVPTSLGIINEIQAAHLIDSFTQKSTGSTQAVARVVQQAPTQTPDEPVSAPVIQIGHDQTRYKSHQQGEHIGDIRIQFYNHVNGQTVKAGLSTNLLVNRTLEGSGKAELSVMWRQKNPNQTFTQRILQIHQQIIQSYIKDNVEPPSINIQETVDGGLVWRYNTNLQDEHALSFLNNYFDQLMIQVAKLQ